jgi:hypothetical protein
MRERIDNRPKMIARELNADTTLTEKQRDALYLARVACLPKYSADGKLVICLGCEQTYDRQLDQCPNCEVWQTIRCLDCNMPEYSTLHLSAAECRNRGRLSICSRHAEHHQFI